MTEVEEQAEFKFDELSDKAKEHARDTLRYSDGYLSYDWWDGVYEDAVRMAKLLGIWISSTQRRTKSGRTYTELDIHFSGFSSQGDGASFEGTYTFSPTALFDIQQETVDPELIRIAQGLTVLQLTRRMHGFAPFSAEINVRSPHYCHSGTMDVDMGFEDDDEHPIDDITDEVTQLMRDFADWIYARLSEDNDWLMSDDVVDERLREDGELYDEAGDTI